jgi:hypothetical protein
VIKNGGSRRISSVFIRSKSESSIHRHLYERQRYRKRVKSPRVSEGCEDLTAVQDKGADRAWKAHVSLLFKMLEMYDMRIVIPIMEKDLRIVTAHIQDIRKRDSLRRWPEVQIDHDDEEDILWVHGGREVKESLELDGFVIDFAGSEVVGLEIMNASAVLTRYTQDEPRSEIKKMLGHIASARLRAQVKEDIIFIVAYISFEETGSFVAPVPIALNLPRQVILARA